MIKHLKKRKYAKKSVNRKLSYFSVFPWTVKLKEKREGRGIRV